MRSYTLAVLGLMAVSNALPTPDDKGVERRQGFTIGKGKSGICTELVCEGSGASPITLPPGFLVPELPELPPPEKREPQGRGRGGDDDRRGGNDDRRGGNDRDRDRDRDRGKGKDNDRDRDWERERGKSGGGGPPRVPDEPSRPNPPPPNRPNPPQPNHPSEPEYPEPDFGDFPGIPDDHVRPPTKEEIKEQEQIYMILKELIRTINDPVQRRAMEQKLRQIEEFLRKYAGISDIYAPPGTGTSFTPGKRSKIPENSFKLLDAYTRLVANIPYASDGARKPSLSTYLVACQLAELLISEGHKIDTSILDSWSHFGISDKVKRQIGGIFLPGSCSVEDIIGLQTLLTTIQLIYGPNPPAQYATLRNAVAAALQFCKVATPGIGPIIPNVPVTGGPLVPEKPVPGGPLVPEQPVPGGPLVPEKPVPGGPLVPERPVPGGPLVPERPVPGGPLVPERPVPGAPLVPEKPVPGAPLVPDLPDDGAGSDFKIGKRQHPQIDLKGIQEALELLAKAYGSFGSKNVPMPVFMIMQDLVALLQSYGVKPAGWPDLVGQTVKLLPPAP